MTIAIYTHPDCLKHDTGAGHPENIGRLTVILNALKTCDFASQLEFIDAPMGEDSHILLAHTPEHLDIIKNSIPNSGYRLLDGADTIASPGSLNAAYRAVGAACAAVDKVLDTDTRNVFCAIRPPGHHAEKDRAMGFCIFDNIAIATLYALVKKNLKRVAIVDFDVHHGNGTQDIVQSDERILFISSHQSPLYPGTGFEHEKGVGNIINIELQAGLEGMEYREIFTQRVLPALENFKPELLLISAGFDAHTDDPLANINLTEEDYGWIGQKLRIFSENHCSGRIVSILEGGYNHTALAASVTAYLRAFLKDKK